MSPAKKSATKKTTEKPAATEAAADDAVAKKVTKKKVTKKVAKKKKSKKKGTSKKPVTAVNSSLVLFGEGDLATACLEALAEDETLQVPLLVTRAAGADRSHVGTKQLRQTAKRLGIEVMSFRQGSMEGVVARIQELAPGLVVFTDFYRMDAENLFPGADNCLRLHCSLLPKLRGADPLRRALDNGDKVLGATLIQCDEEPYAGSILGQSELETDGDEKYGLICDEVHEMAAELLVEVANKLVMGKRVKRTPQSEKGVTKAGRMTEQHRRVPWVRGAVHVYNRLRAFAPQPGLVTLVERKKAVIEGGTPITWEAIPFGLPGTFLGVRQGRIAVLCGQNSVFGISRIGWEGEEAMGAAEFMSKERLSVGSRFV